jgi:hypothetical protein
MTEALNLELPSDLVPTTREDLKYDAVVREVVSLDQSDLQALSLVGPARSQAGLQHIRAFHHAVALKLACGEKPVEICAALSISPQTICKLEKDEQFQQLVISYREQAVTKAVDSFELTGLVTAESLSALHERLIGEDRDQIPLETLRRIAETGLDRTGLSPIRRSETMSRVSHDLSTQTIERLKQLHGEDATYDPQAIPAEIVSSEPTDQESNGATISISDAFSTVPEKPLAGEESGGEGV